MDQSTTLIGRDVVDILKIGDVPVPREKEDQPPMLVGLMGWRQEAAMSNPAGKPLRIRHLTSVHDVDDSRILRRECRSLARAGDDVALIVGRPPHNCLEGVRIVGVGAPRNRLDRASRVAWKIYRAAWRERADIYQFHDPELLWVGLLLKLRGGKVVYDVHEDVPKQIMNKFWLPRLARPLLAVVAKLAEHVGAAVLDAIVAATPAIAERFPTKKTVVVQNFPEVALAQPNGSEAAFEQRPFTFAYTGGLTGVQGVREIVATSMVLGPEMPGVLAGWFHEDSLEREIRATPAWQFMRYLGRLPHPQVIAAIRSSRCGIVVDRPISNYLEAYSTKMFEYMACGIPVICSDFPLWVRLVGDADCGITVDPLNPTAIADAIKKVIADPEEARRLGENGRRAIIERYNWDNEFIKLDALYRRIA
jgi:glycosyltransferase involved in cell wall biosynthesis